MSSPFTKGDPSCLEGTATPFLIDCAHRYAHIGEYEVHDGGIWWSLLEYKEGSEPLPSSRRPFMHREDTYPFLIDCVLIDLRI